MDNSGLDILGQDRMEILGRRSDRLDSFSRGPDKLDGGSDDLDYRSDQPASNIEIDISSMESNSEVSKTPHTAQMVCQDAAMRGASIGIYNWRHGGAGITPCSLIITNTITHCALTYTIIETISFTMMNSYYHDPHHSTPLSLP